MASKHPTDKRISTYAIFISIISIVITVVFSIKQCNFENKLHKLHIDPTLDSYLIRSINKKSLEFHLKNKSPIPVVNLSVDHKYFLFFNISNKYVLESPADSSIFDTPSQNWIFKKKLEPNESIGKKENQIPFQLKFYEGKRKIIIAAIFEITFYREFDMKQFNNKAIFFLDWEKIYSYKNALNQDHLKEPIQQLPAFERKMLNIRKESVLNTGGNRLFQKAD